MTFSSQETPAPAPVSVFWRAVLQTHIDFLAPEAGSIAQFISIPMVYFLTAPVPEQSWAVSGRTVPGMFEMPRNLLTVYPCSVWSYTRASSLVVFGHRDGNAGVQLLGESTVATQREQRAWCSPVGVVDIIDISVVYSGDGGDDEGQDCHLPRSFYRRCILLTYASRWQASQ